MKIDNIFFKFLILVCIILLLGLANKNINEMYQNNIANKFEQQVIEKPNIPTTTTTKLSKIAVNVKNQEYCNSLNPLNCNLERCVFSRTENKCNSIDDNLFTDSEVLNQFYKETMVFHGLEKDRVREIINPTPFLSLLDLFEFGGTKNPGYIFITEFYGNNTSISLFFSFNEFTSETMPLITTDNWSVYIKRYEEFGEIVYFIEFKFNDNYQTFSHPAKLKPGEDFYFFGLNLTRTQLTLYLMNTELLNSPDYVIRYRDGEHYKFTEEILDEVDTRTTTIFIGCNLVRNKFFHGYLGKFNVTKNQQTINDLKRLSMFFSKSTIDINQLDKGQDLDDLLIDTTRDNRIPSKIFVSATVLDNTIDLYWLPPEIGSETIKTYIIILIGNNNDVKYLFNNKVNCNRCTKKINDLEYDSVYLINVVGVNDNGVGLIALNDFITINIGSQNKEIDMSMGGFSKNPDKISCNPDGSFNIGHSCFKKEGIEADIDKNIHDLLIQHLKSRPNYNVTPKIELV